MNKARNELVIKVGGKEILLRPTFENIAAMETNLGSVAYLGWKYSRGVTMQNGKAVTTNEAIKSIPSMTEVAQIIYYNQASTKPEDSSLKKYSLEEIWDMMLKNGAAGEIVRSIVMYLAQLTAGDKINTVDDLSQEEKKSTSKAKSQTLQPQ